jgi:hypothetical protein
MKPKRMHWTTYEQSLDELYELEAHAAIGDGMGLREALIRALEKHARDMPDASSVK